MFVQFTSSYQNLNGFVSLLQELRPRKKFTARKLSYWFRAGKPIKGIVAKTLANIIKRVVHKNSKKDAKLLMSVAEKRGVSLKKKYLEMSDCRKDIEIMMDCLRVKFLQSHFRELLQTGDAILYEKALRGSCSRWNYSEKKGKGGDELGKALMRIRDEL